MNNPHQTSKQEDNEKMTGFDYFLLALIVFTYPFIAWMLIKKVDMIAYILPTIIFIVAAYITYAALKDFVGYYREVTNKK